VEVQGGSSVKAKNVILATGSEAKMLPGLKPDDRVLTNIEILDLKAVPKSLVVVGAGAVGVEFASIYKSFDCDVTVLEMLPRLVPLEDEEISKELMRAFNKRGIKSYVGTKVEKIEKAKTGIAVAFTPPDGKQQRIEAEKILIAVGRAPNTPNIGLEKTKIKLDRAFIHTNEWMETEEPGVYAVGDIIAGFPQLAHVAFMQGMVAVAHIAGKPARPLDRNKIPNCTYCEPQISSVGMTEAVARQAGRDVKIGKFPFSANSRASIVGSHEGFVKVVADARYGEVLGVHIIGPQATEMIAEAVAAMGAEATIEDLMFTIHPHPTLSEAMFDGIENVYGLSINI
jgi:dihydrolipoamide dehydrogenase